MMKLDGLVNPFYIILIFIIFVLVYAFYSQGSHRYQVIHEGFKLSQNKKDPDETIREKLAPLSAEDIDENTEERAELNTKKERINRLLDEAYKELNENKDQEDYAEIISDINDLVDANILDHIMKNKDVLLTADLTDARAMKQIEHINNLENFKAVLTNMTSVVTSS